MKKVLDREKITIKCPACFDLALCLDCGQAFRWEKEENGWRGVISGREYLLNQVGNTLEVSVSTDDGSIHILKDYFDFNRDYDAVLESLNADRYFSQAAKEYYGIRILRQQGWEALCSFIISQNNNIPRIKGIISRLCESFGEKINDGAYSFPSAERLAGLEVSDLAPLRSGFRAKYIIDAAKKVSSGEVDLKKIQTMPIDEARQALMSIKGVGPKVAECTLLYGFNRLDAFPVDVWVKRILRELYPDGLPVCFSPYEGIAQQYLFHWRRNTDTKK
ncbi:MAG: DNA-3-methyladenine glycosylase 2 family protein [Clostridia bacterium]|nr:DNA-3-methyladenine glycosylase 2 family protein [Clostridia bacterium]